MLLKNVEMVAAGRAQYLFQAAHGVTALVVTESDQRTQEHVELYDGAPVDLPIGVTVTRRCKVWI